MASFPFLSRRRFAQAAAILVAATALNPYIGYGEASRVAKIAVESRRSIREVALAERLMTEDQLAEAFLPENLLGRRP